MGSHRIPPTILSKDNGRVEYLQIIVSVSRWRAGVDISNQHTLHIHSGVFLEEKQKIQLVAIGKRQYLLVWNSQLHLPAHNWQIQIHFVLQVVQF